MSQRVDFPVEIRICLPDAIRRAGRFCYKDPELLSVQGPSKGELLVERPEGFSTQIITFRFAGGLSLKYWVEVFDPGDDFAQYRFVKILARYYPEGAIQIVPIRWEVGGQEFVSYRTVKGEKVEEVIFSLN